MKLEVSVEKYVMLAIEVNGAELKRHDEPVANCNIPHFQPAGFRRAFAVDARHIVSSEAKGEQINPETNYVKIEKKALPRALKNDYPSALLVPSVRQLTKR